MRISVILISIFIPIIPFLGIPGFVRNILLFLIALVLLLIEINFFEKTHKEYIKEK